MRDLEQPDPAADTAWPLACAGVASVLALLAACFVELLLAVPLPGWFYAIALGTIAILASFGLAPRRHRWNLAATMHAIWVGCALLGLVTLHLVPWTTRKPFLAALDRVCIGMTYEEVEEIMSDYRQGTGWQTPEGELRTPGMLVFRHSDDARFNSDWGMVTFVDGRVTKVAFSPD